MPAAAATVAPTDHADIDDPNTPPAANDALGFAYRVCAEHDHWQRPTWTEMQAVFADNRFGIGHLPFPAFYLLWLSDFVHVGAPPEITSNVKDISFSGRDRQDAGGWREHCGYAALPRTLDSWRSLWLIDHRITGMTLDGDQLTVTTDEAPGLFQDVVFPYPPDEDRLVHEWISSMVVVDASGVRRFLSHSAVDGPWTEWHGDSNGQTRFAIVQASGSGNTAPLPLGGTALSIYPGFDPMPAGAVAIRDADGVVVAAASWDGGEPNFWEPVARLDVPAGDYTIELDGADGTPYTLALLADDLPLPDPDAAVFAVANDGSLLSVGIPRPSATTAVVEADRASSDALVANDALPELLNNIALLAETGQFQRLQLIFPGRSATGAVGLRALPDNLREALFSLAAVLSVGNLP